MRIRPRPVLAFCAVALVLVVVITGAALGPDPARRWLMLAGLVAAVTALQAVGSDPRDLTPALLFSLFPILALLADGSPSWLIGPLAACLLVAGELAALSWDCQGKKKLPPARRRRITAALRLGGIAVAGGLGIGLIGSATLPGGPVLMLVGVAALAGTGTVLFGSSRARQRPRTGSGLLDRPHRGPHSGSAPFEGASRH